MRVTIKIECNEFNDWRAAAAAGTFSLAEKTRAERTERTQRAVAADSGTGTGFRSDGILLRAYDTIIITGVLRKNTLKYYTRIIIIIEKRTAVRRQLPPPVYVRVNNTRAHGRR